MQLLVAYLLSILREQASSLYKNKEENQSWKTVYEKNEKNQSCGS